MAAGGDMSSPSVTDKKPVVGEAAKQATANQKAVPEGVVEKKAKAPSKEKKPRAPKSSSSASHPSYFQMIKEAILALKERTGSSPQAIAKYLDGKYKGVLPANYRKILTIQLRNSVAKGNLVKVKGSFKLSEAAKKKKPDSAVAKKPKKPALAAAKKKKPTTAVKGKKPSSANVQKKSSEGAKKKAPAAAGTKRKAPGAAGKPKVSGDKKLKTSVLKKNVRKAAPAKAKKPKSVKSPAAKKPKKAVSSA